MDGEKHTRSLRVHMKLWTLKIKQLTSFHSGLRLLLMTLVVCFTPLCQREDRRRVYK